MFSVSFWSANCRSLVDFVVISKVFWSVSVDVKAETTIPTAPTAPTTLTISIIPTTAVINNTTIAVD